MKKCLIFQALASPKKNSNFPAWKFIRVLAHLELLGPESCMVYLCDWSSSYHKSAVKHFFTLTCLIVVWNDFTHKSPMRSVEVVKFQPVCNMANHLEAKFRSWKVGIRFLDLHWKSHKTSYSLEANGTKHHHLHGSWTSNLILLKLESSRVHLLSQYVTNPYKSLKLVQHHQSNDFNFPPWPAGSHSTLLGISALTLARMTKGWMSNHFPQLAVGILANPPCCINTIHVTL